MKVNHNPWTDTNVYMYIYEGCPKRLWTHVILFKIEVPLSGKYYNIVIKSIIMYMYKNQSNVYFCNGVMNVYTLPIQAAQPSMTLNYNDIVLGLFESNMLHSPFGQKVQSHIPSTYHLCHLWISFHNRFIHFSFLLQLTQFFYCQRSDEVAFSCVFKDIFLP